MDLLRSSSAPFVIAALLSILGWHIGTLTKDIRDTRSVVYQVEDRDPDGLGSITAVITNVSKSQMLEQANFALVCEDLDPCLDYDTRNVVIFPPTADDSLHLSGDQPMLGFTVDLAAGGRIGVTVKRKTAANVKFLFFPKGLPFAELSAAEGGGDVAVPPGAGATKPGTKDVYVLNGDTLRGWVVLHYFNIVLGSFFLVLAVFVFGTLAIGIRRPESQRAKEDGEHAAGAEVAPDKGEAA